MRRALSHAGLLLALFGPAAIAFALPRLLGSSLGAALAGVAAMAALCLTVLAIVRLVDKRPWSAIGLRRPAWSAVPIAFALIVFFRYGYAPLQGWFLAAVGSGYDSGFAKLAPLPVWYRLLAVAVIAPIEEVLYRGVAIDRLTELLGNKTAAAIISSVASGLVHAPFWGWWPSIALVAGSVLLAASYLWRGDLWANMIAHVVGDSLAFAPL